ncbi:hypothetical protein [Rhizobium sp. 1399]|jgi:hypothetical protein|uniref:hypothetical protein n=1 Tax=Rhizobium sp. 1399 TaxID=2817758 RepID=UPI00285D79E8|nr:hypothetical protein [Rhizobium sp. 1399]MDR6668986.1 hypothetical protein [Rhizobium sp. 1399]
MAATKERFFKQQGRPPARKAEEPPHAAYAIMATEARQRDAKTAKLRALRLEREASSLQEVGEPVAAKPKPKPAVRRSRYQ